ncbi:Kinase family protein [Cinnamomum micranthum f. kanehirae]|uniref:Kinase family protein n=1 Tax=Cinnamomum micranthum f. kanehirae TaxID=337451 RepID=A0A3S3NQG4_9MAGN|nr:Kinase family protein [Cinnamomum micranthum f. kanehirae]
MPVLMLKQDRACATLEGIEPICALAVRKLKDLGPEADTFVKIIDMMLPELETFPGVKMITIQPHTEKKHPSVLTNEPISLPEMGKEGKKLQQVLPKNQDDKVAALHHEKLGAKYLTPFKPARSGDKKKKITKRETPFLAILLLLLSIRLSFVNSTVSLEVDQQLDSRIPQWESRFAEIECKQSNPFAGVTKKLLPIKPKKIYKAKEIKRATNSFSSNNLLNSGGNGEVYWGKLEGTEVAVKRPYQGEDIERYTDHIFHELKIHGQVNHQSIVPLLGHGLYHHRPHIIYEFMPGGNLFEQLHDHYHAGGSTILTWQRRLTIAYQIAECLTYLHNYSVPRIFHVDVKSKNILFDDNLNAKLSDFGHSQIIEPGQSHISMAAEGTPHLIDPYWRKSGRLTDKTDVYSFGILLVELLTRKTAKILKRGDDGAVLVKKHELMDAIDPSLKVGASEVTWKQMMALGSLAVDCLSKQIKYRPPMKQVADKIECIRKLNFCPLSVTYVRSQKELAESSELI